MPIVQDRRKVTTYGKLPRTASLKVYDLESPPKKQLPLSSLIRSQSATNGSLSHLLSTKSPSAGGKLTKPSVAKPTFDEFDIPDSDGESRPSPVRKPVARFQAAAPSPKLPAKSKEVQPVAKPLALTKPVPVLEPPKKQHALVVREKPEDSRKRKRGDIAPPSQITKETTKPSAPSTGRAVQAQPVPKVRPTQVSAVLEGQPRKRQRTPTVVRNAPARTIRKGVSAPAVLSDMVPMVDDDTPPIDAPPKTPIRQTSTLHRKSHNSGTITPKERDLWNQLLVTEDMPDGQVVENLRSDAVDSPAELKKPQLQRGRSRLMDTLKQASNLAEPDSDSDSVSEDDSDVPMASTSPVKQSLNAYQRPKVNADPVIPAQSRARATYGQNRTYRAVEPTADNNFDMFADELQALANPTPMGKRTQQLNSQSQGLLDMSDDEDDSQRAAPRSVFDLKAAGTRKRLLQELDSLANDLAGSHTLAVKRSAMFDLTIKLLQPDAVACALENGIDHRLVTNCAGSLDPVLALASAFAFISLINGGADTRLIAAFRASSAYQHIFYLKDHKQSIAQFFKRREFKMSKIAQLTCVEVLDKVFASGMIKLQNEYATEDLTPRTVSMLMLDILVQRWSAVKTGDLLMSETTLSDVLDYLSEAITDPQTQTTKLLQETVMSILEHSSLYQVNKKTKSRWTPSHLEKFASAFAVMTSWNSNEKSHTQCLALKVCVNVTNDNPTACAQFSTEPIVLGMFSVMNKAFDVMEIPPEAPSSSEDPDTIDQSRLETLDRLILSLGALMNLAEHSVEARTAALSNGQEQLHRAVSHFFKGQKQAGHADSLQEAQMNIPYGYLSVLLGTLCLHDEVRKEVVARLPMGKLDVLVDNIDTFIAIHRRTYASAGFEGGENIGLVERMNSMVDKLRENC